MNNRYHFPGGSCRLFSSALAWLLLVAALFFQPLQIFAGDRIYDPDILQEELSVLPDPDDSREFLPLSGTGGQLKHASPSRRSGSGLCESGSNWSDNEYFSAAIYRYSGNTPVNVLIKEISKISVPGRAGPLLC